MPAYRDEKHGTFYASFYYTDFTGARRKKMKRGFKLKRDAQEWERQFLLQRNADPDMKFGDFVEIYRNDKRERIREHTWESKDNMINTLRNSFKNAIALWPLMQTQHNGHRASCFFVCGPEW